MEMGQVIRKIKKAVLSDLQKSLVNPPHQEWLMIPNI